MKDIAKYVALITGCTFWCVLCFILPDFIDNPWQGLRGWCTMLLYVTAIGGASFLLLYAVAVNKYLFSVFLPVFALMGTILSYYRIAFKATLSPIIIDASLHTSTESIAGLLSMQLFGWILFNLAIAVIFVVIRYKLAKPSAGGWQVVVVIGLLLVYYNCNSKLRTYIRNTYPFNIGYNLSLYIEESEYTHQERQHINVDVTELAHLDSIDVVLVLGEALRADHLSLNGYPRVTSPQLCQRTNLVSFANIYSEYTHTEASVPHILTPADSLFPQKAQTHSSFIPYFTAAEFYAVWLSNQNRGSSYTPFIEECDTNIFLNLSKSGLAYDKWLDEELLFPLNALLQVRRNKNLYIVHTIGSHWFYDRHVPTTMQHFQPVTDNRVITGNSLQQIINSYDNTALYMDWFVDTVISRFEDKTAVVIYLSDHGEALGENGHYLHAGGTEPEKHPACVIWYSDRYKAAFPEKVTNLQSNKDRHYRTDFLFYSILSAVGIEAEGNNPAFDIFAAP